MTVSLGRLIPCLFPLILVAGAPATRPNLLVIHTDEHNFRTLGCYRALLPPAEALVWGEGVEVKTPNIDWIARNGALCDRFYATSPVCTPSRASFVSGRYPQNTGAIRNDLPMRDDVVTFAEVLRRAGYATGYAGKWHLDGPAKPGFSPSRQFGFEDNTHMFNRGHWKQLELTAEGSKVKAVNDRGQPSYAVEGADETSFTTDFLTDRAIEFIRKHREEPFCYMVSYPDPHGPNSVRPPYDTRFDDLKFQEPASAKSADPGLPSYAGPGGSRFTPRQMSLYFGMVQCIDDNVGRLLDLLRSEQLLDRTFVVFTSDHGDMCGEHGRHNKGIPLEASARVPFLLYAPGRVPPGSIVGPALTTADFKPTILSLMGVENGPGDEGRNATSLFAHPPTETVWRDVAVLRIGEGSRANGWLAAVSRRYKLVVSPGDDPCLFDLESDPFELVNRFADPALRAEVRMLGGTLRDYARDHNEPFWQVAAVRADLEWAADGTGPYHAPRREKVRPEPADEE